MTEMVSWSYWFPTVDVAECYGKVPYSGAAPEHQEWSQTKRDCVQTWCLRTMLGDSNVNTPFFTGTHAGITFLYSKTKVDPDASEAIAVLLPKTLNYAHRFKMASDKASP